MDSRLNLSHCRSGAIKIINGLQIYPKFSSRPKVARLPKRGIRSDGAPLLDDLTNPRWRNPKVARDPVDTYPEISHELLAKNFTWVKRARCSRLGITV